MKKFIVILMALLMLAMASVSAYADADDEIVHAGTLPATSEQAVKITIKGLTDGSGDDPANRLPSEYHVRVIWDIQDGLYSATATDSEEAGGFKNFRWDCETLDFYVNEGSSNGGSDVREGNWLTKPKVAFEVTNASTPDLPIYASAALKGDDAWAEFISSNAVTAQNTAIGTQTVAPVLKANLGKGVNSYELNAGKASHNVYAYEYQLDWNYDALNQFALDSYKNGTASTDFTNTFVVTVSATSGT